VTDLEVWGSAHVSTLGLPQLRLLADAAISACRGVRVPQTRPTHTAPEPWRRCMAEPAGAGRQEDAVADALAELRQQRRLAFALVAPARPAGAAPGASQPSQDASQASQPPAPGAAGPAAIEVRGLPGDAKMLAAAAPCSRTPSQRPQQARARPAPLPHAGAWLFCSEVCVQSGRPARARRARPSAWARGACCSWTCRAARLRRAARACGRRPPRPGAARVCAWRASSCAASSPRCCSMAWRRAPGARRAAAPRIQQTFPQAPCMSAPSACVPEGVCVQAAVTMLPVCLSAGSVPDRAPLLAVRARPRTACQSRAASAGGDRAGGRAQVAGPLDDAAVAGWLLAPAAERPPTARALQEAHAPGARARMPPLARAAVSAACRAALLAAALAPALRALLQAAGMLQARARGAATMRTRRARTRDTAVCVFRAV